MTLEKIATAGGDVASPRAPQVEGEAIATSQDPAGKRGWVFQEHRR